MAQISLQTKLQDVIVLIYVYHTSLFTALKVYLVNILTIREDSSPFFLKADTIIFLNIKYILLCGFLPLA